jgi:hypothetical protein
MQNEKPDPLQKSQESYCEKRARRKKQHSIPIHEKSTLKNPIRTLKMPSKPERTRKPAKKGGKACREQKKRSTAQQA